MKKIVIIILSVLCFKIKAQNGKTFPTIIGETLDGKAIREEMMKGDYEHLVNTFDKHFGHFVTLYK